MDSRIASQVNNSAGNVNVIHNPFHLVLFIHFFVNTKLADSFPLKMLGKIAKKIGNSPKLSVDMISQLTAVVPAILIGIGFGGNIHTKQYQHPTSNSTN